MYVCVYVLMYERTYVYMYVCICESVSLYMYDLFPRSSVYTFNI